jgi:hypothetical protein
LYFLLEINKIEAVKKKWWREEGREGRFGEKVWKKLDGKEEIFFLVFSKVLPPVPASLELEMCVEDLFSWGPERGVLATSQSTLSSD